MTGLSAGFGFAAGRALAGGATLFAGVFAGAFAATFTGRGMATGSSLGPIVRMASMPARPPRTIRTAKMRTGRLIFSISLSFIGSAPAALKVWHEKRRRARSPAPSASIGSAQVLVAGALDDLTVDGRRGEAERVLVLEGGAVGARLDAVLRDAERRSRDAQVRRDAGVDQGKVGRGHALVAGRRERRVGVRRGADVVRRERLDRRDRGADVGLVGRPG